MTFQISHGFSTSATGSSKLVSGDETVICTVSGPSEILSKTESYDKLVIEVKFKHFCNSKPHEAFISDIMSRLASRMIICEVDKGKRIMINLYSNTLNLSYIFNSMMAGIIDAGMPLHTFMYSTGDEKNLFVFSEGELIAEHSEIEKAEIDYKDLYNIAHDTKNIINTELNDMLNFN